MDASLPGIDAVFLDLDGTVYLGGELIDGAEAFLSNGAKRRVFSGIFSPTTPQNRCRST